MGHAALVAAGVVAGGPCAARDDEAGLVGEVLAEDGEVDRAVEVHRVRLEVPRQPELEHRRRGVQYLVPAHLALHVALDAELLVPVGLAAAAGADAHVADEEDALLGVLAPERLGEAVGHEVLDDRDPAVVSAQAERHRIHQHEPHRREHGRQPRDVQAGRGAGVDCCGVGFVFVWGEEFDLGEQQFELSCVSYGRGWLAGVLGFVVVVEGSREIEIAWRCRAAEGTWHSEASVWLLFCILGGMFLMDRVLTERGCLYKTQCVRSSDGGQMECSD